MHANRIAILEGLALRVDRGQGDLRGIERVDASVRRAACV